VRIKARLSAFWFATIIGASLFAGASWLDVLLSPEAGGQTIQVTGTLVFPVITALLLLQAAGLLTSYFAPNLVGRLIAGLLSLVMIFHFGSVVVGFIEAIEKAISSQVFEATGVLGQVGQDQFVAASTDTYMWAGYLVCLFLNIGVLIARGLLQEKRGEVKRDGIGQDSPSDLWEGQN
jgi:hypothetical protein